MLLLKSSKPLIQSLKFTTVCGNFNYIISPFKCYTNLGRLLWCRLSTFCLSNVLGKWFALNVDLFST